MKLKTYDDLLIKVARGAAELDRLRPGWWDRVRIDRLHMSDTCRCIIGQLEQNFWSGMRELFGIKIGQEQKAAYPLGLDSETGNRIEYGTLKEFWTLEIYNRRESVPVDEPVYAEALV